MKNKQKNLSWAMAALKENAQVFGLHCVISVRIRSFSGPNAGKYENTKTPNTDTFHAVLLTEKAFSNAKTFQYPVTVLPLSLANTDSSLRQQKRS